RRRADHKGARGSHLQKGGRAPGGGRWAFFGVDRGPRGRAARDSGGRRPAVVRLRNEIALARGAQMIGVDEIGVPTLRTEGQVLEDGMWLARIERVPTHVWDFQIGVGRADTVDLTCYPPQTPRDPVFAPGIGHELHAHADAEERLSARAHPLVERIHHSRNGIEAALAIRKSTDPRQYDAVGAPDYLGIAGDDDLDGSCGFTPGALECLGRRMQVTGA